MITTSLDLTVRPIATIKTSDDAETTYRLAIVSDPDEGDRFLIEWEGIATAENDHGITFLRELRSEVDKLLKRITLDQRRAVAAEIRNNIKART